MARRETETVVQWRAMLRIAAVILLAIGIFSSAQALAGKCLLRVDGETFIDGPCSIRNAKELFPGFAPGTFSVYARKDGPSAIVELRSADTADGTWNYGYGASNPTGILHRDGACWVNEHAKICAWR